MKITTNDKIIAWLTLFSGLTISAVAVWYSVAGLVSIFAAAAVPIIVMGVALEVSKLVATVWLKFNWHIAPRLIKTYLIVAITILMLITSMGIFGFLSKAHLDQAVPTGDVADKVALIDEKIKTQKDNVDAARKAIRQMDDAVDQTMSRSTDEKGADKAATLRRAQQRERAALQGDIAKAQKEIATLNEERAPVAKELRKVEAEVGPIKYIAALLYGDNPDQNILDKAVTWVIIIIVIVFDPLAVILLLASQYSFVWFRKQAEDDAAMAIASPKEEDTRNFTEDEVADLDKPTKSAIWPAVSDLWPFPKQQPSPAPVEENEFTEDDYDNANVSIVEPTKDSVSIDGTSIDDWNKMIEEAEKAVEQEKELEDHEIISAAADNEKANMQAWKHDNPEGSLKSQRRLFEAGIITKLPWEDYLKAKADFKDNEAAEEAAKWALEQLEERPGDYLNKTDEVSYMENVDGHQVKKTISGYQQNAEQSDNTIWKRIKKSDNE